ncbi:hypothetical protein HZC30_05215 [Candidatus Woesearchaeota archaeon]|nr:hypothetical protein [Candidatus Woesearchaeota archaeon]
MKITIDTKEDNHEDIKKVIALLNGMIGNSSGIYSNQPTATPADSTNLMSMFGDEPAPKATPDTAPNFGSFLNLVDGKKKEEPKGIPKIVMY